MMLRLVGLVTKSIFVFHTLRPSVRPSVRRSVCRNDWPHPLLEKQDGEHLELAGSRLLDWSAATPRRSSGRPAGRTTFRARLKRRSRRSLARPYVLPDHRSKFRENIVDSTYQRFDPKKTVSAIEQTLWKLWRVNVPEPSRDVRPVLPTDLRQQRHCFLLRDFSVSEAEFDSMDSVPQFNSESW